MAEGSKWILPLELLENSPSRADGVTSEEEKTKGYKSAWFMEVFGESIGR